MSKESYVKDHGKVVAVDTTKEDGTVVRQEAIEMIDGVHKGEVIGVVKNGKYREVLATHTFGGYVYGETSEIDDE